MQEFRQFVQFILLCKTFFQVILDRLDVMVGGRLNGFDPFSVLNPEIFDQAVEVGIGRVTQVCYLWDISAGSQCLEPADLDDNPVTDQAVFTENFA